MSPDWSPSHERAATLAFDRRAASARLDASQKASERKTPYKGRAASLLLRFLFIGFMSADYSVTSNRGRCHAMLASSWMEIAAMLVSAA